jgi:hypothetical protein
MKNKETLEEAAERLAIEAFNENLPFSIVDFANGYALAKERMYSDEDLKHAFFSGCQSEREFKPRIKCWEEFIEKFKKK